MRNISALGGPLILALAALAVGCHNNTASSTGTIVAQPAPKMQVPPEQTLSQDKTPTPMQDAINTLLAREAAKPESAFPAGVKLKGISVHEGVATLDFSSELNGLDSKGETGGAEVQRMLRQVLEPFHDVEKMRVTVEGGPLESQATDWSTPFPIRQDTAASPVKTGGEVKAAASRSKSDRSQQVQAPGRLTQ